MKFLKKLIKIVGITIFAIIILLLSAILIRGLNPFNLLKDPVINDIPETIVYKEIDNRKLEIHFYEPNRNLFRKTPLLIYVHGGSWKYGTHKLGSEELENIFNPVRNLGVAIASIQYRLTDDSIKFPDHINDVTDAIRFIVKNEDRFGIDSNRISLIGASAGAHLNLLAALNQDSFYEDPSFNDVTYKIRSIVSLATPLDLVDLSDYSSEELIKINELLYGFFGFSYEENPDIYHLASPMHHVSKTMPPIFLVHGEFDELVPVAQADRFHKSLVDNRVTVEYIKVKNGGHSLSSVDSNPTDPQMKMIVRRMAVFLIKYLLI